MAITLHENFRAIFYAPYYAAHALEAYAAEGVEVALETSGAPRPMASGLAGEDGVWWGGPMRILVARDRDPQCKLVSFCEVVTRDPFFVVGVTPRPEFHLKDLAGLRLGTVSEVPTPWMCLQDDLRRTGIEPKSLDLVTGQTMAENAAALGAGSLDAAQLFQPYAEQLVRAGTGHIWYAAASRGPTSYTSFFTTEAMLDEQRPQLLAMTRAILRTQKWLHGNPAATVAAAIAGFFSELEPDLLAACVARYKGLGLWGRNPILAQAGFERLQAAFLSGGLIERGTDYADGVDNSLAEAAMASDPPSR